MRPNKFNDWSKGINNQAPEGRLPEGAVRDLLNIEPHASGSLSLRPGMELVASVANTRGAVASGNSAVIVADRLLRFDAATSMLTDLGVAPAGPMSGAELNGDVFLNIGVDQKLVRGTSVVDWAVPTPVMNVTLATGASPAGLYRVAVTAVDSLGREGGCDPMTVSVVEGQALVVAWDAPAGYTCRVYASATNGETLYLQTTGGENGSLTIQQPTDDGARLLTANLKTPPYGDLMVADGARLLIADGGVLWFTQPYAPHLTDRVSGFVQYPGRICVIAPVDGGVFVVTDTETYFITDLGTEKVSSSTVQPVGAVWGSAAKLPTGEYAWMTKYGQATGKPDGSVDMPHTDVYAPSTADRAVAGVVDHAGTKRVVTTFSGPVKPNTLGVDDFFDMEIS